MLTSHRRTRRLAVGAISTATTFSIFMILAQTQTISVPIFTPTTVLIEGLQEKYNVHETVNFVVKIKGYGSNCHQLDVSTSILDATHINRVAYYSKADDCRFMAIIHGPYNFTKAFSYGGGGAIFDKEGTYTIDATFNDLVDHHSVRVKRPFFVQ